MSSSEYEPGAVLSIWSWRLRVPKADAIKAGVANDETRLIPRPPARTGKLACSHWLSANEMLQILLSAERINASNWVSSTRPAHSDDLSVCCMVGALNEARSRTRASWDVMSSSREIALSRSLQRCCKHLSIAGPMTNGAPSRVADVGVSCMKSRKRVSSGGWSLAMMDSHFWSFRNSPRDAPSAFIIATSEATVAAGSPRVTSSMKAIFSELLHDTMRG